MLQIIPDRKSLRVHPGNQGCGAASGAVPSRLRYRTMFTSICARAPAQIPPRQRIDSHSRHRKHWRHCFYCHCHHPHNCHCHHPHCFHSHCHHRHGCLGWDWGRLRNNFKRSICGKSRVEVGSRGYESFVHPVGVRIGRECNCDDDRCSRMHGWQQSR